MVSNTVLAGVSIGTIIAGSFLLVYVKKVKSKLKKYVLRQASEGKRL